MLILDYVDFFHDGSIDDIQHQKDDISIVMESAEMDQEDVKAGVTLSQENTLKGTLLLREVVDLKINDKPVNQLKMLADSGTILEFDIDRNTVNFFIWWINFPPHERSEQYTTIEIAANEIFWNNEKIV